MRKTPTETRDAVTNRPELVLAAADEAVWDWDLASGIAYLSPRYYAMTGYEPGEVTPDLVFFRSLVYPDDWAMVWATMSAHIEGGTPISEIEYRMLRRDGEVRWISGKGRVVSSDEAGTPQRMIVVITDITARVEAEQERRLQAEMMTRLVEGFSLVDGNGVIRYTSPAFDAMFGYAEGELIGATADRLNAGSAEEASDTAKAIMAALASRRIWQGELRGRRKDGSTFWTEARISAFQHPLYGPVRGNVQWDISERKREVDLIVEAIAEAVLVVGADGRIMRVNARVTEVFGYAAAELLGQPVEILIPERHRAHHAGLRDRFASETRTRMMGSNRELFGRRKDGSEFPVEVGLGPMSVGDRQYTIVSVADISTLRQSEQEVRRLSQQLAARLADTTSELQASEQNFRELAEHINEVFWLVSPDWRTVHYVSPAYEEVWGRARSLLCQNPLSWLEAVHVEDRTKVIAYLSETTSEGLNTIAFPEFRVVRPDGSERWLNARGHAVHDSDGLIYRIAGMTEDITERKLMDERLRASEERHAEAERNKVEEERRRLSLELHDEVGQMLAALNINLEMVRRKQTSPDTAEPLQNARHITAELMRSVRRIVHQLRPQQLDDLGLAAALRGHLDLLRRNALMAITLTENIGSARLPGAVEMTCFRIVQESLTNAMRHASASRIDVALTRTRGSLALSVGDDGVGFMPADSPLHQPQPGHLGLVGMRERVHGLGGEFQVISSPGKGCRITAVIPINDDTP